MRNIEILLKDVSGKSHLFELSMPEPGFQKKSINTDLDFGEGHTEFARIDGVWVDGDVWRFLEGDLGLQVLYEQLNSNDINPKHLFSVFVRNEFQGWRESTSREEAWNDALNEAISLSRRDSGSKMRSIEILLKDVFGKKHQFELSMSESGLQKKPIETDLDFGEGHTESARIDGAWVDGDVWRFLEGDLGLQVIYEQLNRNDINPENLLSAFVRIAHRVTQTESNLLEAWNFSISRSQRDSGSSQELGTQDKKIEDLRKAGYAVVIFSPDELGTASSKSVEDRLVELGNEVIADLQAQAESNGNAQRG